MDPTSTDNENEAPSTPTSISTSTSKATHNLSMTSAHPLQDVSLTTSHENIPEIQTQQQQNVQSKKNWVKFDDDVNEISSTTNNNNSQYNFDQADIAARATSSTNKLSTSPTALLPPPPQQATSRPRTPIEREKSQTQLQREPVTTSPLSVSPTPAQRSIVSSTTAALTTAAPDVAPAVLTTESTHVNLNASGKAQHHHQQQHQQQQTPTLPQEKQQQKSKGASFAGSNSNNQHHQQPLQQAHHIQLPGTQHHSNNSNNGTTMATIPSGAAAAAAPTATTTAAAAAMAKNNAMHHKSHHHQQQQQQQQLHQHHQLSNAAATASPVEASTSMTSEAGPPAMRTIELSTGRIREGFANGDVIVTLLPANTKWPWITPAIFRPELVPEELMAQGLTLTVEDYVQAMETLVNDYRFTAYNICYKRVLVCWILFAFAVLLALLFSGLQGVALFSLGVGWLFLNASAIFLCMWVKLRLSRGLEKCLARVNRQLIKHKILLILDDRGRISCHKVNLCFLYFDSTQCVNFLNEFLEQTEQNGGGDIKAGWESKLDIDLNDIVIQGSTPVRLSRKQEWGMQMFLRYSSRWGMEALRGLVDITPMEPGRHCGQFQCPCQYIKSHLQCKPRVSLNSVGQVVWTRYPTSLK